MDIIVNVGGAIYGLILIMASFVRNRLTELIRIDAVFIPRYSEKTRKINLVAGIVFLGYSMYSLLQ